MIQEKRVSSDDHSGERRRRRRRSSRRRQRDEGDESWEGEDRPRRQPIDFKRLALRTGVAIVVAALLAGGGFALYRYLSPTERALRELRAAPLVGAVIADHPEVADRLRAAIAEEAREPTTTGPTRPLKILADLRQQFIGPAVRNADDASLIATMAARVELVKHLQKADPPACREFFMGGIEHVDKLDKEGQRLYRNVLVATEAAYRKGRDAPAKPLLALPQITDLLRQAGFTQLDFNRLQNVGALSNDISCEMELKIDSVPTHLPPDKAGAFSRFILGQ